jgi:hypothetical protein
MCWAAPRKRMRDSHRVMLGMDIIAMIPTIAMTIIVSISVNPRARPLADWGWAGQRNSIVPTV